MERVNILNKENNVVGIKITTDKETFTIPVADVRVDRNRVDKIIKAANKQTGSKFLKQSYSAWGYKY